MSIHLDTCSYYPTHPVTHDYPALDRSLGGILKYLFTLKQVLKFIQETAVGTHLFEHPKDSKSQEPGQGEGEVMGGVFPLVSCTDQLSEEKR